MRFCVTEVTKSRAGLGVKQIQTRHEPKSHREISVPTVSGFEAREPSRVGAILRGGKPTLDPGPPQFSLDADEPLRRNLMIAAKLPAEHTAFGIVVERAELGWKKGFFEQLCRVGPNGVAEVVRVLAPAVSGMYADVASGPIE